MTDLDHPCRLVEQRERNADQVARQLYDPWSHRAAASDANGRPEPDVIDFGHYTGWRIADVARHDPDHLRWLSRHSTAIHHLDLSMGCLSDETNLGRRTGLVR